MSVLNAYERGYQDGAAGRKPQGLDPAYIAGWRRGRAAHGPIKAKLPTVSAELVDDPDPE